MSAVQGTRSRRTPVVAAAFAILGLMAPPLHASVTCPELFKPGEAQDHYYALVFQPGLVGDAGNQLINSVSPMLADISRAVARQAKMAKPSLWVDFRLCEYEITPNDFSLEEVKRFLGYRAIFALWQGREGGKDAIVQLAIPVYVRMDGAPRREAEIVTPRADAPEGGVEAWTRVLNDESTVKPLITLGLAAAYYRRAKSDPKAMARGELAAAWVAYCDSRNGLVALGGRLMRPDQAALERDIVKNIDLIMVDLKSDARAAGVQLQDCVTRGPQVTP